MTELGAGVDELERDLLERDAFRVRQQRLAQREHALLGSDAATADHEEVVADLAVVREAAHRRDRLLRDVVRSRAVVLDHLAVFGVNSLQENVIMVYEIF